jgi:hypothetical protein
MKDRRREDRLYPVVLLAFLLGLVAIGLLGVPALLVAALGAAVAAVAIGVLHGRQRKAPARYMPSVLEPSSLKRRRTVHLRRHKALNLPLRFR